MASVEALNSYNYYMLYRSQAVDSLALSNSRNDDAHSDVRRRRVADIFVSYTSSDREWAQWIALELERFGHVACP